MSSDKTIELNGGEYCRVHIRVRCEAPLGQSVAVSGSTHQLGYFDEKKVVPLVTTPESYPVWYTKIPLVVPRHQLVHYKFCLMEAGALFAFEKRSFPRTFLPDDADTVVEDNFSPSNVEDQEGDVEAHVRAEINAFATKSVMDEEAVNRLLSDDLANKRLFIVCYHLPVIVRRTGDPSKPFVVSWGESLIAKSDGSSVSNMMDTFWMGTVSVPGDKPTAEEQEHLVSALKEMNCLPVFLNSDVQHNAYHGYCKQVMWPVFHNVDQLDHIHAAWNLNSASSGGGSTGLGGVSSAISTMSGGQTSSRNKSTINWSNGGSGDKFHEAFLAANSAFYECLIPIVKADDVVWVHDYHLMQLPQLLREGMNSGKLGFKLSIVFYMHIPFPTSQIFRSLTHATNHLEAMTCADVVGFHAFDHVRHFLHATKRMLGIRSHTSAVSGGVISLKLKDREVIVTMSHVSIEPALVSRAVADPEVQRAAASLRAKYEGKKIIVGVDMCQRLSGCSLKLAAFEKLLTDYANSNGSVVLVQRCIRPGSHVQDEATTSDDLKRMIASINSTSASQKSVLIEYEEVNKILMNERVALWLAADVFLLTCVREGLNLMPLEYIYARKDLENAGVVVASEFSTVSSLLSGALKINPFYALHVADTLDKALCMTPKECNNRRQRDISFVSSHPSSQWTKQILADLVTLKKQMKIEAAKDRLEDMLALARGGVEPLPVSLDRSFMLRCYESARTVGLSTVGSRVFIFDYGGVLLFKEKFDIYIKQTLSAISGRRPTDAVMEALRKLSDDPHNVVLIVTGLTKLKLGGIFSDLENVTLATSNGLVYSWGRNLLTAEEWDSQQAFKEKWLARGGMSSAMDSSKTPVGETTTDGRMSISLEADALSGGRHWDLMNFDIDWLAVRNIAMPIITKFTFRTNGTCLTPRIPGIGWSYFGADPDWSEKQANQLKIELEASLANHDVKVVSHIQGSIEVVPSKLTKGNIVTEFMNRVVSKRAGRLPIFALVMGDDPSDDVMFEAMFESIGKVPSSAGVRGLRTFTVCVGKRQTPADFFVDDVKDVEDVLSQLAASSTTEPVSD